MADGAGRAVAMPWQVSLATGLPTSDAEDWDGAAAAASIFAWAGWPDDPDPARAGRGFIWRNTDDPERKGSFKAPVARVIDGRLTVIKGGVRAALSRGPQASIPEDVKERGLNRLRSAYWSTWSETEQASSGPSTVLEGEAPGGYHTFARQPAAVTLHDDEPGMEGYLVPKYVLSDRGTYFVDGAFKKTAREQVTRAHHLYQHWPDLTIGRHRSAVEDERGLRVVIQLNEAKQLGADVMSDYRFGIPYGWSYGFDAVRDRSGTEADDARLDRSGVPWLAHVPVNELRAVTESKWWESSTVTWGAIHSAGPDVVQRRALLSATNLSLLLAAIRDGALSDEQLALAEQIVEAMTARAAAGTDHRTREDQGHRNRTLELEILREIAA